jgi:uncharacterized membrane protein YfcA/nucleotide-binding universal stress UspA family protein
MFDWVVYLPISGTEVNAFALVLLGFTVGVIGGFFGVGGAFMVTPALNVFGFPMAYAIGTDMAHIAGKSIVSTFKHRKFGNVDMKLALLMIIGTVVGIELGATLILFLERIGRIGPIVRITYMCLLFGLGAFMLYEYMTGMRRAVRHAAEPHADPGKSKLALWMQGIKLRPVVYLKVSGFHISIWVIIGMGVITGFLAGFLGVGGGFIRMPALMYIIGAPTKVAVGTDLFEVMVTGAYGAFSYALKGRVELLAAMIMLVGAAMGAQLGATATLYARGTIIRLYFAITMLAGGTSVVFKHFAEAHKDTYRAALDQWARTTSGISDRMELGLWLQNNKAAVKSWFADQPEAMQQALAAEKMWSSNSGYLMLGSACALSAVIIFWLVRGVLRERAEGAEGDASPVPLAGAPAGAGQLPTQALAAEDDDDAGRPARNGLIIVANGLPTDLPAARMGAQIAAGLQQPATLLVCDEPGGSQATQLQGRQILERAGLTPRLVYATGKFDEDILRRSADARLLVIGARPLTSLDPTWHLGDEATRIVRHMTTSTLVVRGREQVRRIVLSTDLPASPPTVRMALAVALATGASVEVLYTVPLPTMYMAENPSDATEASEHAQRLGVKPEQFAQLQAVRSSLVAAGVAATVKLRQGIVEEEIIKESVEGDFDLIVLREGYLRTPFGLLLGRLSTNLATRSPQASVLIVKR